MRLLIVCLLIGTVVAQPPFNNNPLSLNSANSAPSPFQPAQLGLDPNFGAFRTFQLSSPSIQPAQLGHAQAAGVSSSSQGPSVPPNVAQIQTPQFPQFQMPQLSQPSGIPQLSQTNGIQTPSLMSHNLPSFNQPLSPPAAMTSFAMPNLFNFGTPAPAAPAAPLPNLFQQPPTPSYHPMFGMHPFPHLFNQPFPQMNILPYQQGQTESSQVGGQIGQNSFQQPQTIGYQQQTFNGVIPVDNVDRTVTTQAPVVTAAFTQPPQPSQPFHPSPQSTTSGEATAPAAVSVERIQQNNHGSIVQYQKPINNYQEIHSIIVGTKEEVSAAEMPGEDRGKYSEETEATTPFRPVTVDLSSLTTTMKPKVLDFRQVSKALKEEALEIAEGIEAKQKEHKSRKLQKYRKESDSEEVDVQQILTQVMDAVMPMQPKDVAQQKIVPSSVKFNV